MILEPMRQIALVLVLVLMQARRNFAANVASLGGCNVTVRRADSDLALCYTFSSPAIH